MIETLRRMGVRHERELLASILLDVAHLHRGKDRFSHMVVAPGAPPRVVRRDGSSCTDPTRDLLTVEQTIGLMMAASGPTNPGDGPCGIDLDDDSLFYALRGTDHVFVLHFERAGADAYDGQVMTARLWERP